MNKTMNWIKQPLLGYQTFTPLVTFIITLFTVQMLAQNFFFFDTTVQRVLSMYLLITLLILNISFKKTIQTLRTNKPLFIFGILLIFFSGLLLLVSHNMILALFSIPLFLAGLQILLRLQDCHRYDLSLLIFTVFIYAIFFLCYYNIAYVYNIMQAFSLNTSSFIGTLLGKRLLLGPTISCLFILIFNIILVKTSMFFQPKKTTKQYLKKLVIFLLVLFFIWLLSLVVLSLSSFDLRNNLFSFQLAFFTATLLPTTIFIFLNKPPQISYPVFNRQTHHTIFKNAKTWVLILLCITAVTLTVFPQTNPQNDQPKLLFYAENMLGSWDIPSYGLYGRDAAGMFGLLPMYLSHAGYSTTLLVHNTTRFLSTHQPTTKNITRYVNLTDTTMILETNEITAELLSDYDVFIIMNLNKSFTGKEHNAILGFVEQGGSLLVLGDHTNVSGIQDPLNELLAPFDIAYRFDSALPLDTSNQWITSAYINNHPITNGIIGFNEIQISVGASLDIGPHVFPLIIGTYGFSDQGDATNPDIAYLGDYTYQPGEHIGDVILAAATTYGSGKIVVFGDTSTFQNTALPSTYFFITNTFSWLCSPTLLSNTLLHGVSLMLFVVAGFLFIVYKNHYFPHAFIMVFFCIFLLATMHINTILIPQNNPPDNNALIDRSLIQRFNQLSFTDESLSGFMINLQRNNIFPVISKTFSEDHLKNSVFLILNTPTKTITPSELQILNNYMQSGGIIILTTGYPDKQAATPLLNLCSLDIIDIPLGPVPEPYQQNSSLYEQEPRFIDAWPIIFTPSKTIQPYYTFTYAEQNYTLIVYSKIGTGGLLLISDSGFLYDTNLESIYDYHPGNIILLKNLIDTFTHQEVTP